MTTNPVPHAWVADLFRRLNAVYGVTAMEARYPARTMAQTVHAWSEALAGFPPAAVQRAVETLAKDGPPYPPTLPEFVEAVHKAVPRERMQPKLPPPARTEAELERGRAHLAQIRSLVARRPRAPAAIRDTARQPGDDDEPVPAASCTCWTGLQRLATRCPSCAAHGGLRERQQAVKGALR